MLKTAICSGSFDPITLGHLDIIRRAAALFDRVVVCVVPNAEKPNQMFTPAQKLALVRAAVSTVANVSAELWGGLLVDFAAAHEASAFVRGVRSGSDFDAEAQMTRINRDLPGHIDTLLLPASGELAHISSTMAREMIRYKQPLETCLPAEILPLIAEIVKGW